MSLSLALNNALSGLAVSQRSLAVLSNNIANANTPGYSRQVLDQTARYVGGVGQGVDAGAISRKVDVYLQRAIQSQSSDVGAANVTSDYMGRLQILLGDPSAKNSLNSYTDNFFNALQDLSLTPESSSLRTNAVNAGATLASNVSDLADSVYDLRFQADQDITQSVNNINSLINKLYNVNIEIGRASAIGDGTANLEDDRDNTINSLSQEIGIKVDIKEDGEANVYTANGITLLDANATKLSYSGAQSVDSFANNSPLGAITVTRISPDGNALDTPRTLVSGGTEGNITSIVKGGKLQGLLDLRDHSLVDVSSQLDTFAAQMRDQVNAIHNDGSGYPGTNALMGTRLISATGKEQWGGNVMIAALDSQGQPLTSPYADERAAGTGIRPLTLDLSTLDSGFGPGLPTNQTIIDQINSYFGAPQNRAVVGNLNNIQLTSRSNAIPGLPPQLAFDFNLENISSTASDFVVKNVTVLDDTATNITSVSTTLPNIALDPANTFNTTVGSKTVTVNTAAPHGLANGDKIYLGDPGVPVGGSIPGTDFGKTFTVSNVTATSFDITVDDAATSAAPTNVAGQNATPVFDSINAGGDRRTDGNGVITASLAGNTTSAYYDVAVDVAVVDGNGNTTNSTVTYRVFNNQSNLLNDSYAATAVSAGGSLQTPTSTKPVLRAMMVDANGNELPKINGLYTDQPGYLKIMGVDAGTTVAINEMGSNEEGLPAGNPITAASNRGFSHYFELNDFFESNAPINGGDTLRGSAANMAVEDRLLKDPNLVTTGKLALSSQPASSTTPLYTYERDTGDNSQAQALVALGSQGVTFGAAGGLPLSSQSFVGYAGQILGYSAATATAATDRQSNSQALMDGFTERAQSVSGVNIDEELANTIIYQNAYSASARVVTVTQDMFGTLLTAFGG